MLCNGALVSNAGGERGCSRETAWCWPVQRLRPASFGRGFDQYPWFLFPCARRVDFVDVHDTAYVMCHLLTRTCRNKTSSLRQPQRTS